MKLALGPIQYYWPKEAVYQFYSAIEALPVDIVYLGETVCAKRHELRFEDWLDIGNRLHDAGKEVVMSTQVLLESDSHLNTMRRITGNASFPVEANDMGAVRLLSSNHDFIAGMHLNIYNPFSLRLISDKGAKRWVMPLEMNKNDLEQMILQKKSNIEVEVFVLGRMPLAFSARCFTARHYNLPKDDCQFRCLEHPEGLSLRTREQEDFLIINGIQTQSDKVYSLLGKIPDLAQLGVDVIRISPQWQHTSEVIQLFADVMKGKKGSFEAEKMLETLLPTGLCNGYWHNQPGMAYIQQETI